MIVYEIIVPYATETTTVMYKYYWWDKQLALVSSSLWVSRNKHKKRTRQGNGGGTKWGCKGSKRYKKRSRGQGK